MEKFEERLYSTVLCESFELECIFESHKSIQFFSTIALKKFLISFVKAATSPILWPRRN
jgi:hypothetical protein